MPDTEALLIWQLVFVVFVGGWALVLMAMRVRRLERASTQQPLWSVKLGELREEMWALQADHHIDAQRHGRRLRDLEIAVSGLEREIRALSVQVGRLPDLTAERLRGPRQGTARTLGPAPVGGRRQAG